jgi:hypothetical protein
MQNAIGTKVLADNIVFDQFSYGIHAYGSSAAYLRGFEVEGNVLFNNGAPDGPLTTDLLIAGGSPVEGALVEGNYTYRNGRTGAVVKLGYYDGGNRDVTVSSNYFVGRVEIAGWQSVVSAKNTIIDEDIPLSVLSPTGSVAGYSMTGNEFFTRRTDSVAIWAKLGTTTNTFTLPQWQSTTGLEQTSRVTTALPSQTRVVTQPNRYEANRGTIVVYNWANQSVVSVDLSRILHNGARYEIRNAQDFFATPVAAGTYTGGSVSLPMTGLTVAQPIGGSPSTITTTGPEFNAFVVVPAEY